jgi:hypothetical protein
MRKPMVRLVPKQRPDGNSDGNDPTNRHHKHTSATVHTLAEG